MTPEQELKLKELIRDYAEAYYDTCEASHDGMSRMNNSVAEEDLAQKAILEYVNSLLKS